ncbi:peptidase C39 family protein [Candidatus Protochlamydia amoebophila]|nr:peptidase C39 family protein [Candidatus Protochlamydia amoebophila]
MKNIFFWSILMILLTSSVYTNELMHRSLLVTEKKQDIFVWEEMLLNSFDELIVSWDAKRPVEGSYLIQVSLFIKEWSPWLDYAFWGAHDQYTFKKKLSKANLQVCQNIVEVLKGNKANGFRIRVIAKDNASLEQFRTLHISATDHTTHKVSATAFENIFINLEIAGLSQITLPDERHLRLCSPTSTTAVIRFLSNSLNLSPLEFADTVIDSAFDIYGSWILNTAQASHKLGNPWNCFVARFTNFNQIVDQLRKGYPVIVSVKGPLKGSALPYESGHLLVVKGYDSKKQEVFCMDPAFSANELTHVTYALDDFLVAWGRRKGIAYVFDQ